MTVTTETGATEPKQDEVKPEVTKTDASKTAPKLTAERASSIGWYFIESYYELYNKSPENLYKLYNQVASLTHGEIPSISKTVYQASSNKSLKSFFSDLKAKDVKNKIIVTNADIQISLNDNILIVVNGEWSKNDSPYCQFNQTFLLSKGINDSNYDIANDVLRYIDYDFKHDKIVEKPSSKKPVDAETTAAAETTADAPATKDSEENGSADSDATAAEEKTPAPTETSASTSPASETAAEGEEPAAAAPTTTVISSWADLAAKAKDKTPTVSRSPSVAAAKSVKKPAPVTPPAAATPPLTNGKYKKEDWFPIYVRGCENLKEQDIKDHLTKHFGKIKFIKQNMNIALIDFVNAEGQRKALDAQKTVINDVTIFLEVRESKAARKDPKIKDKANDLKRKTEKKPLPKKK